MPKWIAWVPLFFFPLFFFYIAGESPTWFTGILGDRFQTPSIQVFNTSILGDGIRLPSNQLWKLTIGQLIIFLGVLILYVELLKSTQTSQVSIIDHTLSTFVAIGYFGFFLSKPWAANDVFLILMSMSFLDVIAGFTITITTARRDFSLGGLFGGD